VTTIISIEAFTKAAQLEHNRDHEYSYLLGIKPTGIKFIPVGHTGSQWELNNSADSSVGCQPSRQE
jgi:hypothetical protein